MAFELNGPLNRLNAILSLLQSFDRCRIAECECNWKALSRPILLPRTVGVLNSLVLNRIGRAHTNGGVQQRPLLRRVLRRVLETAFEKVLRRVLRRCLAMGFNGKKGSEKGS